MAYFEIKVGWVPVEMVAGWLTTRYDFIINPKNGRETQ
jgi:hypothetical protein